MVLLVLLVDGMLVLEVLEVLEALVADSSQVVIMEVLEALAPTEVVLVQVVVDIQADKQVRQDPLVAVEVVQAPNTLPVMLDLLIPLNNH